MVFNANKRRKRQLQAADGYLDLDMPDQALRVLSEVLDPGDDAFKYHFFRGQALRAKAEHRAALASYETALGLSPNDIDVLMGMAWCFKRTDQLDRSIEAMQIAHRFHPTEPVILYNLACYYSLAGNKQQALSWLGRALRMERSLANGIPDESDFDPLRNDPDFRRLLELLSGAP